MSIVSAKQILIDAATNGYAVGAFNVTNLSQMDAVIEAATIRRAPLIIQTSAAPTKFLKPEVIVANKADLDPEGEKLAHVRARLGPDVPAISAATGQGIKELTELLWQRVRKRQT